MLHYHSATLNSATVNNATTNSANSKRATSDTEALKYCNINSETRSSITLK